MARKRNDMLQDLVWRLRSLPRRLRGEVPGASKAEALEDVLLLGTFAVGALIFLVFVASTFGGSSTPTYAAAPRDDRPVQHASHNAGPKDLRPVKGFGHAGGSGGAAGGGGGGGGGGSRSGGGGGGAAQPACDPELPETVRNRAGFRMFSFWRDRQDDLPNCQTTDLARPGTVRR